METTFPAYDPLLEDEVLDEHGLSKMARKLHAAACQKQVGKTWKQMRSPPPSKLTSEVWQETKKKLRPHGDAATPSADAKSWHPMVEQCTTVIYEFKHNKAADAGGWATESAKAVSLLPHLPPLWGAWLAHLAQAHPGADQARTWHAHKRVCLKKPAGGHHPILISSVWIKMPLSRNW